MQELFIDATSGVLNRADFDVGLPVESRGAGHALARARIDARPDIKSIDRCGKIPLFQYTGSFLWVVRIRTDVSWPRHRVSIGFERHKGVLPREVGVLQIPHGFFVLS